MTEDELAENEGAIRAQIDARLKRSAEIDRRIERSLKEHEKQRWREWLSRREAEQAEIDAMPKGPGRQAAQRKFDAEPCYSNSDELEAARVEEISRRIGAERDQYDAQERRKELAGKVCRVGCVLVPILIFVVVFYLNR